MLISLEDDIDDRDAVIETVRRALEVNGLVKQAFEPEPTYAGQKWYDRIPTATFARASVITKDRQHLEVRNVEARRRNAGGERMDVELTLYDVEGRPLATMPTDLALTGESGGLDTARIFLSGTTLLTPAQLLASLTRAYCDHDRLHEAADWNAFRANAEYVATKLLRSHDDADLMQIIRATDENLTARIRRKPDAAEDIRITIARTGITVDLVNHETSSVTTRSASYAELRATTVEEVTEPTPPTRG